MSLSASLALGLYQGTAPLPLTVHLSPYIDYCIVYDPRSTIRSATLLLLSKAHVVRLLLSSVHTSRLDSHSIALPWYPKHRLSTLVFYGLCDYRGSSICFCKLWLHHSWLLVQREVVVEEFRISASSQNRGAQGGENCGTGCLPPENAILQGQMHSHIPLGVLPQPSQRDLVGGQALTRLASQG